MKLKWMIIPPPTSWWGLIIYKYIISCLSHIPAALCIHTLLNRYLLVNASLYWCNYCENHGFVSTWIYFRGDIVLFQSTTNDDICPSSPCFQVVAMLLLWHDFSICDCGQKLELSKIHFVGTYSVEEIHIFSLLIGKVKVYKPWRWLKRVYFQL